MRHDALSPVDSTTHPSTDLARYLASTGSALSVEQATDQAVLAWIAADRAARCARNAVLADSSALAHDDSERKSANASKAGYTPAEYAGAYPGSSPHSGSAGESPRPATPPLRGYRWKLIFLPEGTRLRMDSGGRAHYACVEGDQIIFRGVSVSPRGMTLAVAGNGRNAWSELALFFPGERIWVRASRCRADLRRALLPDEARPYGKAAEEALRGLCMIGTALRGPGMQPPRAAPPDPASDVDPRSHLHDDLHAVMRAEKRADMRVEGGRFELRRFGWPHHLAADDMPSAPGFTNAKPDAEPEAESNPEPNAEPQARTGVPQPEHTAQTPARGCLIERRIPKQRRDADFLEDCCAFD